MRANGAVHDSAGSITHSRIFKAQFPHRARHYRVVTFDGRGNGRSGMQTRKELHSRAINLAGMAAILDTTDTERAILMAHCNADGWAVEFAASHRDRVDSLIAIEPGVPHLGPVRQRRVDAAPS